MAWGFDPVTGQWSTNPHVTTSALQGYQPGGALPAGFLEQMRQMYANGQGGEYTDPATGYTFAPNLTDGRFNGGTLYQIQGKGDYTTPGYVYDASGRPTDPGFQIEHKAPGFMDNYGWMVPLAAAGGAAAIGLGGAGTGAAAGATGATTAPVLGATGALTGTELGTLGAAGSGALGAGAAGAIDLGGGLMMTADGAIVGATGALAPATAAEMAGMGVSAGAAGAGGLSGLGGALTKALGGSGGASSGFNWGSLIGPALSAVGGVAGANAAKSAAEVQAQSTRDAQAKLEPWYQAGGNALARLQEELGLGPNTGAANYGRSARDFGMSDFQTDPGYQFRQQEGEKALQRAASAQGGIGSGKFLKDAMAYNQGQASNEYTNAFNRFQTTRTNRLNPLQSLAGQGQSTAQMVGDLSTQAGNAQAAGKVGQANAFNNALTQGFSMYNAQNQQDQNNSLMNLLLRRG